MEYCAHGDLVTERPRDWAEMHQILVAILEALALTHANGVLHRDLKPGNVLIAQTEEGRNEYKLADFGLAWSQDRSADLNRSSQSVGTPNYMAPEVCQGQAYDYKADVWSAGCVLFELLNFST